MRRNDQRGAAPERLEMQKSILRRPGTDGTCVRHEGKAGVPYMVRTFRDAESSDQIDGLIDAYKDMEADLLPYKLVWEGVDYELNFSEKVVVLRVGDFDRQVVTGVVSPARKITTSPALILQASWILLPVEAD